MFSSQLEPIACLETTNRAVEILDANYEKAVLGEIVNDNCAHLSTNEQTMLLALLLEFEELFDGTLGDWKGSDVSSVPMFLLCPVRSHNLRMTTFPY